MYKLNRHKFIKLLNEYNNKYPNSDLKFTLAIDFDNTLCNSKFPKCGDELPLCDFIRSIQDLDYEQVLWTLRHDEPLEEAIKWCNNHGIRIDRVNESDPRKVSYWGDTRKISYNLLLDDCSFGFSQSAFKAPRLKFI